MAENCACVFVRRGLLKPAGVRALRRRGRAFSETRYALGSCERSEKWEKRPRKCVFWLAFVLVGVRTGWGMYWWCMYYYVVRVLVVHVLVYLLVNVCTGTCTGAGAGACVGACTCLVCTVLCMHWFAHALVYCAAAYWSILVGPWPALGMAI